MLSVVLAALAAVVVLLLSWIVLLEGPRLAALLAEIKQQQHAHVLAGASEGEDAEAAVAHSESLQFATRPLTLSVHYVDVDGSEGDDTGTAEMLTIVEPNARRDRPLFLMICGNPGLVAFYKLFLLYLHRLTKGAVEFRAISYVGHTSESLNNGRTFPFRFQLAFFDEVLRLALAEVGPRRKLFLAGHSVGAYTVLHMLNSLPTEAERVRVTQAFMLMPTIMDIAATPNGVVHTPALRFLQPVALAIVALVSVLPSSLQQFILTKAVGLHPYEVAGARGLLRVSTAAACVRMAHDEMCQIGPLDFDAVIRPHIARLYFIWGQKDAWAPLSQLQELKVQFRTQLRYELAHKDAAHAFVVGGAHLIAPVVVEQLRPFL